MRYTAQASTIILRMKQQYSHTRKLVMVNPYSNNQTYHKINLLTRVHSREIYVYSVWRLELEVSIGTKKFRQKPKKDTDWIWYDTSTSFLFGRKWRHNNYSRLVSEFPPSVNTNCSSKISNFNSILHKNHELKSLHNTGITKS